MQGFRFIALILSCLLAGQALAQNPSKQQGDWILRVGAGYVDPKSNNLRTPLGTLDVDGAFSLTFNGTYMVTDSFGVELLASLPFEHDIDLKGTGEVGSTKHLPPTLSAQWHFPPIGRFQPYVGAGVNWTIFFSEDTTGALSGSNIELDDSLGLAAQVGTDFTIRDNFFVNFEIRWIDIDADLELDGSDIGSVEIDPLTYSLLAGWKF